MRYEPGRTSKRREKVEDWWEELMMRDPRFETEIAQARQSLQAGKGIRIEELRAKYADG